MARLYDSHGTLLGGLYSSTPPGPPPPVPFMPALPARTECGYGAAAYAYQVTPLDVQIARHRPRVRTCHNSVKHRAERYHCDACGGDYCAAHAAPAAHDCALLMHRPF